MDNLINSFEKYRNQVEKNLTTGRFPGFPKNPYKRCWQYPKIMDKYWDQISGSEQKALDYILRHTWGYAKYANSPDCIAYSQFLKGIRKRKDGSIVDNGCGIKSSATLHRALEGLVEKGFITIKSGQRKTSEYRLRVNGP